MSCETISGDSEDIAKAKSDFCNVSEPGLKIQSFLQSSAIWGRIISNRDLP